MEGGRKKKSAVSSRQSAIGSLQWAVRSKRRTEDGGQKSEGKRSQDSLQWAVSSEGSQGS